MIFGASRTTNLDTLYDSAVDPVIHVDNDSNDAESLQTINVVSSPPFKRAKSSGHNSSISALIEIKEKQMTEDAIRYERQLALQNENSMLEDRKFELESQKHDKAMKREERTFDLDSRKFEFEREFRKKEADRHFEIQKLELEKAERLEMLKLKLEIESNERLKKFELEKSLK